MTRGRGSRCVGVTMTGPLGRPELFVRARVALRPVWMSALAVSAETRIGSVSRHADRRGLPKNPSVMPVDAAGSLPSVQLGDEAVVQLAGIIRIEMKAAAFIAAHGAVHDQGGHRH